ncbi:efflux RND transporter periplasmic adaptor subunit [Diaphorobacter aerolatus]|uniref:Efflux RND transporter periplasmic adaptor subunit n=1 Tax=Diaphorobacter aerolatus TaxID=1288495 RepID=A0A7H0GGC1_9BURK|nr:efflux RND transporter periplasmic adaptor subunit [Diaphorobacter aerolatus]QNP47337.1 efflux RND transporter periplasmic adaptor subunit [Diaphorobacter aerolatus]
MRRNVRVTAKAAMLAAVLVATTGWLAGCDSSKASTTESAQQVPEKKPAPESKDKDVVRLQPASVKMLDIETVAQANGARLAWAPAQVAFVEDKTAAVSVPVAARVVSVNAHVGDVVKAGDVLATLVSPDALRTRHELAAARSARDVAAVEAQRHQTMVDKGVGIDVDLRAAQAKLRESSQELSRAAGTVALLGSGDSDRIVLRAPRAGVIAERKAQVGASMDAGSALFTIGDQSAMNVIAQVFESDLQGIRIGSPVQVEVQQLAKPLAGKVRYLGATLDKDSRRASVVVDLDEQNSALRAGMQVRVGVQMSSTRDLMIPVTAVLIKDESRSVVFVQRSATEFEARTVQLGRPAHGMVPVIGGLQPGEKIVVRGGLLLDGAANQLL